MSHGMVAFQNSTFLEWCNVVILHHTVCCMIHSNAVHSNFQGNKNNTTTLNVYFKLCIKLIISTCKKLSGLVRQGDLGHHHPHP